MLCQNCKGGKTIFVTEKNLDSDGPAKDVPVEVDCPECRGTGQSKNPKACSRCQGSTTIWLSAAESGLGIPAEVDCPLCA